MENGNVERLATVHLFDVPRLMKCARNNLHIKYLKFINKNTQNVVKWDNLLKLYQSDSQIDDCVMLSRLIDCHVMPVKTPKMKVRYETRV